MFERALLVLVLSSFSLPLSPLLFSFIVYLFSVLLINFHDVVTGYEPNQLDYSETSAMIFQDESVDMDTEPSYSCDAVTMSLSDKHYLHHCSLRSEKNQRNLRQTYHSHEESLLPAQSFFTCTSSGRPVQEPSSECLKNGNQVATQKTSESGFSLKDKKSKFLLKSELTSRSVSKIFMRWKN